jgi:sugar phosphate permease
LRLAPDQSILSRTNEKASFMSSTAGVDRDAVYRKIGWRLLPFVLACYVVNYLDRVSIGYAKLQFLSELHLNEATFGLITAVFFFGYIAFEVPSNLLLMRVGAPATLTRIMVLWGAVIVSMMFARNEYWFYVQRFLLGAFEAGFFPGVLLYLSFWFPNHRRGRATSLFLVGIPLSGLVGGAISGAVMEGMDGFLGLRGWRWLFLIDGLPAILLGLTAMFVLTDRPENARYLTDAEKQVVVEDMEADRRARTTAASATVAETLRNPKVWLMVVVYFTSAFINTNNIWFPTLLRGVGAKSVTEAGHILAGCWVFAAIVVVLVCGNSDRVGDRKWHLLITGVVGTAVYFVLPLAAGSLWASAVLIALGLASCYAFFMVFWTVPPVFLEARGAAMGIAMISALGQFGGLSGPAIVGWAFQSTGNIYFGFSLAAGILFVGTLIAVFALPHGGLHKPKAEMMVS